MRTWNNVAAWEPSDIGVPQGEKARFVDDGVRPYLDTQGY